MPGTSAATCWPPTSSPAPCSPTYAAGGTGFNLARYLFLDPELELTGEALLLPGDPGVVLITYTVEPNSPSAQALQFLASWSTQQASRTAPTPERSHDTDLPS